MPREKDDQRPESFDAIQERKINEMIERKIRALEDRIRNRQLHPKHAESHGPGGFDPINATGANTPGGGWVGFWPVMHEATELTVATGAITVTQDHHFVNPESGTEDNLSTINGAINNKFLVLRVHSGDKIFITEDDNIECIEPVEGQAGSAGNYVLLQDTEDWALLWYQPDIGVWSCWGFVGEQWFDREEELTLNQKTMALSSMLRYDASGFTIADGCIDIQTNGNLVTLIPETGTTDNLDGISVFTRASWAKDGDWLLLRTDDPGDTITLRHGETPSLGTAKALNMPSGLDIVLDFYDQFVLAIYNATEAKWVCIPLSNPYFTGSGGFPSKIIDADGDTYVDTEKTADSDVIESATAGTIRSRMTAAGLYQLANGTDLEIYSDAFLTMLANIDAATGNAFFQRVIAGGLTNTSFTLNGIATSSYITAERSDTASLMTLVRHSSSAGQPVAVNMLRSRGTAGSPTIVTANVTLGSFNFYAYDGTDYDAVAYMLVEMDGTPAAGDLPTRFTFYTTPDGTNSPLERLRIWNSGGVQVAQYIHAGGTLGVASNNVTAGDITGTRLIVPDAAILHSAITQLGGPVVIPGDGTLLFSDNTNYVGLQAPATPQTENYIYQLPDDDPTNGQVLAVKSTAGSPTISTEWITPTAGSGDVATDTIWNAVGDLAHGTGADTAAVLTVGANDTILMADSSVAGVGLKWQAPATTEIADVATTEAAGTSDTWARGDHVHKGAYTGIAVTGMKRYITLTAQSAIPTVTATPGPSAARYETTTNDRMYMGVPMGSGAKSWFWSFVSPADWDGGVINYQVYWYPNDGSSGNIFFQMRGLSLGDGDTLDTAAGSYATSTDAWGTANLLRISPASGDLTLAGTSLAGKDKWFIELKRDSADGSDTLDSSNPVWTDVLLQYTPSALGTT